MKLVFVVSLICLASVYAVQVNKLDGITDSFKCLLCQDVCKDTESWEGSEEQNHEAGQIAKCEKLLGSSTLAKIICDDFLKNDLDDIIQHMKDPNTEKSDCKKACQEIKMCKST